MLSNVNTLSFSDMVSGNMQLKTSQSTEPYSPVTSTTIKWTYTENGTVMQQKCISLVFQNGQLTNFADTYWLYKVGSLSTISKEEAVDLGFVAAENSNISLVVADANGNPTLTNVKPDWSNVTYDISLNMIPGDPSALNQLPNLAGIKTTFPTSQQAYPSNVARDPLALYPQWSMVYYFSQPIGDITGIQVGVWGDTGQIVYCNCYGFLGPSTGKGAYILSPAPSSQRISNPTATPTTSTPESSTQSSGSLISMSALSYIFAAVCVIVPAIAVGSYLIIHRKK